MARLENGASVLADISYSSPKVPYMLPSYWEFRFFCDRGMLTFNYPDSTVTVYEAGMDAPVVHEGKETDSPMLEEFAASIANGDFTHTESVFTTSESVLRIQAVADRK